MKSGKGPWVPVLWGHSQRSMSSLSSCGCLKSWLRSFWHTHHPKVGIMWPFLLFGLACDCFYQCIVEMTRGNIWGWIIKTKLLLPRSLLESRATGYSVWLLCHRHTGRSQTCYTSSSVIFVQAHVHEGFLCMKPFWDSAAQPICQLKTSVIFVSPSWNRRITG